MRSITGFVLASALGAECFTIPCLSRPRSLPGAPALGRVLTAGKGSYRPASLKPLNGLSNNAEESPALDAAISLRGGSSAAQPQGTLGRLWDKYLHLLNTRPIRTKALSSGIIAGLGDVLGQRMGHKVGTFRLDQQRFLTYTLVGTVIFPVAIHYWFGFLDRLVNQKLRIGGKPKTDAAEKDWKTDVQKALVMIAVDQTVGAVIINAGFFAFFTLLNTIVSGKFTTFGAVIEAIRAKLNQELWPTLQANWKIWPLANFANFLLIPPPLRVLFSNVIAVGWNAFLSNAANR